MFDGRGEGEAAVRTQDEGIRRQGRRGGRLRQRRAGLQVGDEDRPGVRAAEVVREHALIDGDGQRLASADDVKVRHGDDGGNVALVEQLKAGGDAEPGGGQTRLRVGGSRTCQGNSSATGPVVRRGRDSRESIRGRRAGSDSSASKLYPISASERVRGQSFPSRTALSGTGRGGRVARTIRRCYQG